MLAAADAAAASGADQSDAALSAEEAELAAKQAEAARKERLLAAALAKEDAGMARVLSHIPPLPIPQIGLTATGS